MFYCVTLFRVQFCGTEDHYKEFLSFFDLGSDSFSDLTLGRGNLGCLGRNKCCLVLLYGVGSLLWGSLSSVCGRWEGVVGNGIYNDSDHGTDDKYMRDYFESLFSFSFASFLLILLSGFLGFWYIWHEMGLWGNLSVNFCFIYPLVLFQGLFFEAPTAHSVSMLNQYAPSFNLCILV